MPRYAELESVDLPSGAHGVIVHAHAGAEPPAYIVEVFTAPGSMGDGVVDMRETADGLAACDPAALTAILRQPPNVDRG